MRIQQSTRFAGGAGRTISAVALAVSAVLASAAASNAGAEFIPTLNNSSTIPSNGDVIPYGAAVVPEGFPAYGMLMAGDVLVANFNDRANIPVCR